MEITFNDLVQGLVNHPTAVILALALLAIVFLVKQLIKLNDDHKATITSVIPVSIKLGDAAIAVEKTVERLERLMEKRSGE